MEPQTKHVQCHLIQLNGADENNRAASAPFFPSNMNGAALRMLSLQLHSCEVAANQCRDQL